jgi:hypothetical protein
MSSRHYQCFLDFEPTLTYGTDRLETVGPSVDDLFLWLWLGFECP